MDLKRPDQGPGRKKQEKREGLPELKNLGDTKPVFRFAPNPNGPLSFGPARGIVINGSYAEEHKGTLILRFDDITFPIDDYEEPREIHIYKSLQFADENKNGSLLIHCHAGISRSSAIALAIISNKLGKCKEKEAVKILQEINPYCRPNKLLVQMTDKILEREEELLKAVQDEVSFTF